MKSILRWFKPGLRVNNVELQESAKRLICEKICHYINFTDKEWSQLNIWYIKNVDIPIDWKSNDFKKTLLNDLHQERVNVIKSIEIHSISDKSEIPIKQKDTLIKIGENGGNGQLEFYISFQNTSDEQSIEDNQGAWLICVQGKEAIRKQKFYLNPNEKRKWHIGRMKNPYPSLEPPNDIDIKDEFNSVSRQHAIIYINNNGEYRLYCKKGGLNATSVIDTSGNTITLDNETMEILLENNNRILLGDQLIFQFTYTNPKSKRI